MAKKGGLEGALADPLPGRPDDRLVTIIMPAYNSEAYLAEAIESVLAQSHEAWELILVDDGSEDGTPAIAQGYSRTDRRISFLAGQENQGVSARRNQGIDLAKGKWIAFLDSDDMWLADKLEKQLMLADSRGADFIFTGSAYINGAGRAYAGIFQVPDKVDYKGLRKHNVISTSSVLVKRSFLKGFRMEGDNLHEDYAFWLRLLKDGGQAYGLNEPLLVYRLYGQSKSGNKFKTVPMTYKAFRLVGIGPLGSAYFTTRHLLGSLVKYWRIFA